MKLLFGCLLCCLIAAGCSTFDANSDTENRVARHMALADSMEHALALDQATLEYKIVAELYPTSSAYPTAVRKASLLYMNPDNPSRSDSLALHWVSTYLALPVDGTERASARVQAQLLERIAVLQQQLDRRGRGSDSLNAVTRRQETQLSNQAQQIQNLQTELKQVRQELDKLKQVDVQMNKSRRK